MVKVAHTHILTSATIEVPNDATVSLPVTCWLNSEQVNVDVPVRNYGITARRRRMIRSKAKYRNTGLNLECTIRNHIRRKENARHSPIINSLDRILSLFVKGWLRPGRIIEDLRLSGKTRSSKLTIY